MSKLNTFGIFAQGNVGFFNRNLDLSYARPSESVQAASLSLSPSFATDFFERWYRGIHTDQWKKGMRDEQLFFFQQKIRMNFVFKVGTSMFNLEWCVKGCL